MEETLINAGLTKHEAQIYIKLSEIGLSSAYKIAKESKSFRANTYDTLRNLEKKNLVSKKDINGKTLYEANDPDFLINLIEQKKEAVQETIPQLRLLQQNTETGAEIKTYEGIDAFVGILQNFLKFNEPILVYGAPKRAYSKLRYKITRFHEKRLKQNVEMKHIYNFNATERIKALKDMPLTPVKVLPELANSPISTNICGDQVVFVIWKDPIKTIQIVDKDMALAYKEYFKILWESGKEPK